MTGITGHTSKAAVEKRRARIMTFVIADRMLFKLDSREEIKKRPSNVLLCGVRRAQQGRQDLQALFKISDTTLVSSTPVSRASRPWNL